jgi:hypothetical protein
MSRFSSNSGIAIGPILFIIAILGLLASLMSSGGSEFTSVATADRVNTDIVSQANLIRSKINECNLLYGTNNNGDGWPASDPDDGTPVADLECAGDPDGKKNLWTGLRPSMLSPPTSGFNAWYYINKGAVGGRCFWTSPTGGNTVAGLLRAKDKFSSQEVAYNSAGASQRFVVFITRPSNDENMDAHCKSE